jgi:hypothetical protein
VIDHANQAQATNHGGAFATNFPLLLYLVSLFAVLGIFASIVHALMQPIVIPNVGWTGHKAALPPNLLAGYKSDPSAEGIERAATDAAKIENRKQSTEPLFAFTPLRADERRSQSPLSNQKLTNLRTEP